MSNLQDRCQSLEQANKALVEETTTQKARLEQLEEAIGQVNADNEQIQSACQRKIDVGAVAFFTEKVTSLSLRQALNADIEVERETYRKSRAGLDMIYHELQKKYEDERVSKQVTTSQNSDQKRMNAFVVENRERLSESSLSEQRYY